MDQRGRTWLEISAASFEKNVAQIAQLASPAQLGIVVKSNAYGHGLVPIALLAQKNSHIHWLFTAGIREALALRAAGVTKPILAMAYLDGNLEQAIMQDIACVVFDRESLDELNAAAERAGKIAQAHVKIDSGMSRLGVLARDAVEFFRAAQLYKQVHLAGIFTHLADPNNVYLSFTHEQLARFDAALNALTIAGFSPLPHALSTGGLTLPQKYPLVRVGTAAYGFWKNDVQRTRYEQKMPGIDLQPLLTWKTVIEQLKDVPAHEVVGYLQTYKTQRPSRLAIVPIGYADGFLRGFSHKATVIVRYQSVPVIGMVSMNMIVVDVTEVPLVRRGDEVILMGNYPELTPTARAQCVNSINNEIATLISSEIPRIIVE